MLEVVFAAIFGVMCAWMLSRRSHLRLRVRLELLTLLAAVLTGGAYAIAKRFEGGLGAVTHLSDRVPWGIWITFDLCGVALAAGGFLVAGTVHVLHLKRFEPILRPTVLTAFIAYQLVAAVLVLDLGRPQRFWHPLIMWQRHSVMFEITMCLSLYTLVLALEFSPALFDRLGWRALTELVHRLALPLVLLGVVLSTLHQSSFGSLFLIVPGKLHPLWYTPMLPVLFLVSAAAAGLAAVMLESVSCAAWLGRHLSDALLGQLSRACGLVLCAYLGLKVADLVLRRPWAALWQPAWLGGLLCAELLLGVALPAALLVRWSAQASRARLVAGAALTAGGVVLNRANISWFALAPAAGVFYVPSWMEVLITVALVILGVLAFVALSAFLPVFPLHEK